MNDVPRADDCLDAFRCGSIQADRGSLTTALVDSCCSSVRGIAPRDSSINLQTTAPGVTRTTMRRGEPFAVEDGQDLCCQRGRGSLSLQPSLPVDLLPVPATVDLVHNGIQSGRHLQAVGGVEERNAGRSVLNRSRHRAGEDGETGEQRLAHW